ncbi:hypothetical protein EDD22DRAFT_887294 [Suillus occidentalis]|nr:hypothetical protein EDD22DRAFT_887294 [Suillus occidentalis]
MTFPYYAGYCNGMPKKPQQDTCCTEAELGKVERRVYSRRNCGAVYLLVQVSVEGRAAHTANLPWGPSSPVWGLMVLSYPPKESSIVTSDWQLSRRSIKKPRISWTSSCTRRSNLSRRSRYCRIKLVECWSRTCPSREDDEVCGVDLDKFMEARCKWERICCDTWEIRYKMELHQPLYHMLRVHGGSGRLKMDYSASMDDSYAKVELPLATSSPLHGFRW